MCRFTSSFLICDTVKIHRSAAKMCEKTTVSLIFQSALVNSYRIANRRPGGAFSCTDQFVVPPIFPRILFAGSTVRVAGGVTIAWREKVGCSLKVASWRYSFGNPPSKLPRQLNTYLGIGHTTKWCIRKRYGIMCRFTSQSPICDTVSIH